MDDNNLHTVFYTVNTIDDDGPATQGARASVTMMSAFFARNILASAPDGFIMVIKLKSCAGWVYSEKNHVIPGGVTSCNTKNAIHSLDSILIWSIICLVDITLCRNPV